MGVIGGFGDFMGLIFYDGGDCPAAHTAIYLGFDAGVGGGGVVVFDLAGARR